MLERDHLVHYGHVLRRDGLHRLDAAHEIVDALRAEQHGERRLVVTRHVDRDQPLRERALRPAEVRARRVQPDLVDAQALLDDVQLRRRRVVRGARALEARVEAVDLREDALRLGLLRADRRVAGCCAGRDESRGDGDQRHRRLSLQKPDVGLSIRACDRRTAGGRHVTSGGG